MTLPLPDRPRSACDLRLLVVDDDDNTRTLLCEVLEATGAEVRGAASAREAAGVVPQWRPDVLISDISMKADDGYGLVRRVRAGERGHARRMPAIACTGHASPEDRATALRAGFDAIVEKPVNLELLASTIAHLTGADGSRPGGAPAERMSDAPSSDDPTAGRGRSAPDS